MTGYRYGPYSGGPDPLAPPYDARRALDEMGDSVLAGADPGTALRDLLRRGLQGHRGLDDMLRRVREQREEIRRRGRLDGILERARALLDTAIGQERAELFPDPGDEARMREAELDALPADTAQAISRLADYQWRSDAARETFEQLKELLRREVLDSQFRGMKEALASPDPEALQRVKDMLADLNAMLDADARGEHTQEDFDAFMERYGDLFPDRPANLEELVDQLARRAMAAQRLMSSLSAEQRDELAALMDQALSDAGLAAEMTQLANALRSRRPEIDMAGWQRESMTGEAPLGLGDATTALADLADLADLEAALGQDYPGASLDDVDEESIRRSLGRQAVDDMEALRQIERELERQGYLQRTRGQARAHPQGGAPARRDGAAPGIRRPARGPVRGPRPARRGPGRRVHRRHPALAVRRRAGDRRARHGAQRTAARRDRVPAPGRRPCRAGDAAQGPAVRPRTSRSGRPSAAPRPRCACSWTCPTRWRCAAPGAWPSRPRSPCTRWSAAGSRRTRIQVIGFSNYARELRETDLAGLGWDMVQGTNLHHALVLAGRYLDQRPEHDPVVLIVTDGEPTAHLRRDGQSWFDWPPAPETLELTLAEVDKMTRRRAQLNIFMLADDERLTAFVEEVARRNGGRVLRAQPDRLGEYVVRDFLRTRRKGRR